MGVIHEQNTLTQCKNLRTLFGANAEKAKAILSAEKRAEVYELTDVELIAIAWQRRFKLFELKLGALSRLDSGLFDVEFLFDTNENFQAAYINSGDTDSPTILYTGKSYQLTTLGDFYEAAARRGVKFN